MTGLLLSLSLVSALMSGTALCACLIRGDKAIRRSLICPLVLAAAVCLLRYGGNAYLNTLELGWRAPVKGAMGMLLAALILVLLARIMKFTCVLFSGRIWIELGAAISVTLTGSVLALWILLLVVFGNWSDRVAEMDGQGVVVEYSGIFRETGYRYVNCLVHGEKVFEWSD